MINDMGIKVVETAPDADDLALNDDTNITDEDAAEAAAAALSSGKWNWSYNRPSAHVHAWNGYCGAAD